MEPSDEEQMVVDEFENLHLLITKGDLKAVKTCEESWKEEKIFLHDGKSALFLACFHHKYEIISFLIHKGAEFLGTEESLIVYTDEDRDDGNEDVIVINVELVNYYLSRYCKEPEASCVYKLMYLSQSPQVMVTAKQNALWEMYKHFFESETNKALMTVLRRENFNISYDFTSKCIDRMCHMRREPGKMRHALTMFNSKKILVGAKDLVHEDIPSTSSRDHLNERECVYGVVAEELCHLAMLVIFENEAKPYRREEDWLIQEFKGIVAGVKSLHDQGACMEQVIHNVFQCYHESFWECELIARIPHIIGIYGEQLGRTKFQEYRELQRLINFYDEKVHTRCRQYIDELQLQTDNSIGGSPAYNSYHIAESQLNNSHPIWKQTLRKMDYISHEERLIRPVKDNSKAFKDDLLAEHINVIQTNCTKLCTLDLYHELKREYGKKLEEVCHFIQGECFLKKRNEIQSALQHESWEYFILVLDNKDLSMHALLKEYTDYLKSHTTVSKKIILISNSNSLEKKYHSKARTYGWNDLSEEYKKLCLRSVEFDFKGELLHCCCDDVIVEDLSAEDFINIVNRVPIEVRDGEKQDLQGYNPDTYIEREFQAMTFERDYLKKLTSETKIFLSSLEEGGEEQRKNLEDLPFDKQLVQLLKGPNDEIKKDKSVFIINKESMNFEKFKESFCNEKCIWIQYHENEFYLRNSNTPVDVFRFGLKQKFLDEKKILDFLKRSRTVIISDNAGYGKSTVISSLMDKIRRSSSRTWSWRINLGKFSLNYEDPLSLANIEEISSDEEVLEYLFKMLGLNGIKKLLFREFMKTGVCFLFFDGFDEILSDYESNTQKLLSTLRKHAALNLIISTRKHHQERLEHILESFSHQLVPLTEEDQIKYIVKLWRSKLKNPFGKRIDIVTKERDIRKKIRDIRSQSEEGNSVLEKEGDLMKALKEIEIEEDLETIKKKIDELKFSELAEKVIQENSMDKDTVQFMGIPLHLFMVGEIYYNSNFEVKFQSGIYSIYCEFIKKKIQIFVEDKQGMLQNGLAKANVIKKTTEEAYRIHKALAKQLMDNGRIHNSSLKEKEELELSKALGIVFIKGENVDFLHLTFAEYFRAESIRLGLEKETFADVLFEDKFNVVRRFLANSLQERHFENLTEEFLTDFDFLLQVLKMFVNQFSILFRKTFHRSFASLGLFVSAVNILKCLFKTIEGTIDTDKLTVFVKIIKVNLLSLENWFVIGGFISVKMMKMLININFKVNSIMIFGVFLYYSEWKDVKEILDEFISNSDECENESEEKRRRVLEILKLRDGNGRNLFNFALSNERIEVFVRILEYCKKILGKEKFIDEIVKSEEYSRALDIIINIKGFYKLTEVIKSFNSVFGKEIGVCFEDKHKIRIIGESIDIRDISGKALQQVINMIIECFGIANLKKTLMSCDYNGEYFIHYLVNYSKNAIKNHLNIIKKYLDERSEMKQFLMIKNRESRNMFHLAAVRGNDSFGEILKLFSENLEEENIREMLISCDEKGSNVLHFLNKSNTLVRLMENLNHVKDYLADDNVFKGLLKSKNKMSMNIFHFAAMNGNNIDIFYLNIYLSINEIKKLFIERYGNGWTCLHLGAFYNSKKLPYILNNSFKLFENDRNQFKELILAKDNKYECTFLHEFVESKYVSFNEVIEVLKSLKEKVSDKCFKELLRSRDSNGETFLQIQMKKERNTELIRELEKVLKKDLIEKLLEKQELENNDSELSDNEFSYSCFSNLRCFFKKKKK